MSMKKPLGRGLDSLIPRSSGTVDKSSSVSSNYFELPLTSIVPNDNQPRNVFDKELLEELSESIKRDGVIQPIVVTKIDNDKYMIIEGERRWRASGLAGRHNIPAVVRKADTAKERLELALITNIQREDLNPMELARAYSKLMEEHGYRHEDLGIVVGKSRSAVTNRLRLLRLPEQVQNYIEEKKLSEGHARALLGLEDESQALPLSDLIISKNLSVRDVEKLVKKYNGSKDISVEKKEKKIDPNLSEIVKEMESYFQSRVDIKTSKKGGVIQIKYNSDDELDGIIKKIRGEQC